MNTNYLHVGPFRDIRRPIHALARFVTAEAELFVLAHVGIPQLDRGTWRLTVDGMVKRPLALSFDEMIGRTSVTVTAFHKCAGNPLRPHEPTPARVGNVVWRGVRLSELLAETGCLPGATHVWASGADGGEFQGRTIAAYQKDLPLAKAMQPEVLIAWAMNEQPLATERGAPARLVAPGFYGTNSVKWLTALTVADRRAPGPFTTEWYNDRAPDSGNGEMRPVWNVAPDSAIVAPATNGVQAARAPLAVWGWAWGDDEIAAVNVSADAGASWTPAAVTPRVDYSWQRFSATLPGLARGAHRLVSRAQDRSGRTQPLAGGRNAAVPVAITVE